MRRYCSGTPGSRATARGGPAPGQAGEEAQGALGSAATVDAFEALVDAALGAVGLLVDEAAHAHRQGDDDGANDVDDVAPTGAVGGDRRALPGRAQGCGVLPGHVHDGPAPHLNEGWRLLGLTA
jgi:hypothetical protein